LLSKFIFLQSINAIQMKNLFLILILFITTLGIAQNPLGISQKHECTIYLLDGTTKEGIGRFKADDDVKFWTTKESEPEIIAKENIEKIKLDENGIIGMFRYKNIIDEGGMWLKEASSLGEVCLYTDKISGYFYKINGGQATMGNTVNMYKKSNDVITYYVSHKAVSEVLKITSTDGSSNDFKKTASEFFKDCPKLVEKIQSKEYKKTDVESVVWFYNNYCVSK